MSDYAEKMLDIAHKFKKIYSYCVSQQYVEAYSLACDHTELAQELEDICQMLANKNVH